MSDALSTLADSLEQVFDDAVERGNDDELFASGYLRGHFDLVVAQLELNGESSAEALWPALQEALDLTKGELNPQDRQHVQDMFVRLQQHAETV
ncbi:YfcL family protein [Aliidiomarina indica]|uniref:YfcL family protein n=1 Tax=Aliidiomarina indica TaxID=2749147 RepID=UPI00188E4EFD|nr:YfcL family protein [Aliidiomarina indica]